jgi:hypothetical protein
MAVYEMEAAPFEDRVRIFTWTLTSADNEGEPIPPDFAGYSDRSVQVAGSLGGGALMWQGSNQKTPTDWATLNQATGTAAQWNTPGIKQILEGVVRAKPVLVGGSGGSCTVIAMCRKPARG